jgi:hypothetical protein
LNALIDVVLFRLLLWREAFNSTLTIHLLTIPPENGDEDLKSRLENCSGSTVELSVTFLPAGGVADIKAHPLDVMAWHFKLKQGESSI